MSALHPPLPRPDGPEASPGTSPRRGRKPPLPGCAALLVLLGLVCGVLASCQLREEAAPPDEAPSVWDVLRSSADLSALDSREELVTEELASVSGDGYTLAALSVRDWYPRYVLVLGAVDSETGAPLGPVYQVRSAGGFPRCAAAEGPDGTPALLYTANGMRQGLSYGEAGLITLWEGRLRWLWPVAGDLLAEGSQAREDYGAYWAGHLALMSPGGAEIFAQTDHSVIDGDGPQWAPDQAAALQTAPDEAPPSGVRRQARGWLEDFTPDPGGRPGPSAVWEICSLLPEDVEDPDQDPGGERVWLLTARDWTAEDRYLTARLTIDHEGERVTAAADAETGPAASHGLPAAPDSPAALP